MSTCGARVGATVVICKSNTDDDNDNGQPIMVPVQCDHHTFLLFKQMHESHGGPPLKHQQDAMLLARLGLVLLVILVT